MLAAVVDRTVATVSDCTCQWRHVPVRRGPHRVMHERDAACTMHGDGTEWWAEQQRIARALGATSIAAEPEWRP